MMIEYYLSPETQKRILERHKTKKVPPPFNNTFPAQEAGPGNLSRRRKARKDFAQLVKFICASQRRKVWNQLRKDYKEMQREHLRVA
jgi:hypothetical protein